MARRRVARPRRYWNSYRLTLLAILLALCGTTFLYLRGPAAWQRRHYQLHYSDALASSARRHHVSPYLLAAVIEAESDWQPDARSPVGAEGLMQLMPRTARQLARWNLVEDALFPPGQQVRPEVSIEYGATYLRYLIRRYHELEPALAAYNAGLGNADRWVASGEHIRDAIEFPETRHFVVKVVRAKERYEALYPHAFDDK